MSGKRSIFPPHLNYDDQIIGETSANHNLNRVIKRLRGVDLMVAATAAPHNNAALKNCKEINKTAYISAPLRQLSVLWCLENFFSVVFFRSTNCWGSYFHRICQDILCRWLDARLCYLHWVCKWDTTAFHFAIDMILILPTYQLEKYGYEINSYNTNVIVYHIASFLCLVLCIR